MAAKAETNRVQLAIHKETAWNEVPSTPVMIDLPYTSETLGHQKETVSSKTVRSDRNTEDNTEVGTSSQGDINFEYRHSDYLGLLESLLCSNFLVGSETGAGSAGNFQFTGNTIVGPSGWTNDYRVGQQVKIAGSASGANDGIRTITALSATVMTLNGSAFSAQDSSEAVVTGKMMKNGVVKSSWLIEKRFLDIANTFQYFPGLRVSAGKFDIQSKSVITGSFSFMGPEGIPSTSSIGNASTTARSANKIINATSNVGSITEGGSALTVGIKSISLSINNNVRVLDAIAHKAAVEINYGSIAVEGAIEAYVESLHFLQKIYDHTDSDLSFRFTDPAGNVQIVTLPRLNYSDGNPQGAGLNADVMQSIKFNGFYDATSLSSIQWDVL